MVQSPFQLGAQQRWERVYLYPTDLTLLTNMLDIGTTLFDYSKLLIYAYRKGDRDSHRRFV